MSQSQPIAPAAPAAPAARHALADDLPVLERSLALAFVDDPMIIWVSGMHDRALRIERVAAGFFRPSLSAGFQRGHVYTVDGCGAAAVWSPPDVRLFREDEGNAFGSAILEHLGPDAMPRLSAMSELVSSHHPGDLPHFYLFLLGAAQQGTGAGAAVIRPVLDRCDTDGLPAYLESTNVLNVSFYERHGFRVLWEDHPGLGAPLFRGMWRDPQR